jgi:N-acetylneuraminate lyase/4-hydroxy-tetrahydrodipicolinate synthase
MPGVLPQAQRMEPGKVEPAVLADLLVRLQRLEDMAAAL